MVQPTTSVPISTWDIDSVHSLVEFSVRHLMVSTAKGRFGSVAGVITLNEQDLSRSAVVAEIDAATIDTREAKRDAHLRSADFLDVEKYPQLSFKSRQVEANGAGDLRIIGDLTLRDVTREVTLAATLNGRAKSPWGQEVIGLTADASIKRSDFGMQWNVALETGGFIVSDDIKVHLEIEAIRQS